MSRCSLIHYYVEGECEKTFLDAFKTGAVAAFLSGKVDIFNVVNKIITPQRLMALGKKTTLVLVYDIDVDNVEILDANILIMKKAGFEKIIHIQSIRNFEEEILNATSLTSVNNLFNTHSIKSFKSAFINHRCLKSKLASANFNLDLLWNRTNVEGPFSKYSKTEDLNFIRRK